jgi:hypothetical protein
MRLERIINTLILIVYCLDSPAVPHISYLEGLGLETGLSFLNKIVEIP